MSFERHELRTLQAIAETGGFGKAATRLKVSQSAVSQTIANLEYRLETPLLVRSTPVRLTESGERLKLHADRVLQGEHALLEELRALRIGGESSLNLVTNSTVQTLYLRPLLADFLKTRAPGRLHLEVVPSRAIVYGIASGRWELGFGPFHRDMPGDFQLEPLFSETRLLVAAADHPIIGLPPGEIDAALRSARMITSFADDSSRRPGDARLRDAFAGLWVVADLKQRLELVRTGHGLTYVSDRLLAHPVHGRELAVVSHPTLARIPREVGLCYRRDLPLPAAARAFVRFAGEHFGARPQVPAIAAD